MLSIHRPPMAKSTTAESAAAAMAARVLTEEGLEIHSAKMASCRPKRVHRAALAEISNASVLCYKEDGRAHELGP